MSLLYEVYAKLNFPRYDNRTGLGYGAVGTGAKKSTPSVGTPISKQSLYPYVAPSSAKDLEDTEDLVDLDPKTQKKVIAKIGGLPRINDPFASNWVDRGAFVNWATRLDLFEAKPDVNLRDVVSGLGGSTATGGLEQFLAMGNGAGIYKTAPGKTIGMSPAGRPQSVAAVKTQKKIPPSLTTFIKNYLDDDEEEEI